jgi:hypothetical protein
MVNETVLVQQSNGEQYWKKPQDVKPGDVVLHGQNISQTQAQQLVNQARASGTPPSAPERSSSGLFSSPQEAEGALKSMAAGGWNVTGLEQDPRTKKWSIISYGKTKPDFIEPEYINIYSSEPGSKVISRPLTPVEKANLIRAETEKRAAEFEISFGPITTTGGEKIEASDLTGKYVYTVGVDYPEQVQDVRAWAQKQGFHVSNITQGPDKKIILELTGEKQLPEETGIDMRSYETIAQERAKLAGDVLGKKIYEKASPLEQVLLHVRTLLSPAGYEYVGAGIRAAAGDQAKILDVAFPGIKSMEEVVTGSLAGETEKQELGLKPKFMGVEIPEGVVSALNNPVLDIELMFLGGAGLAKFAATKIGGKIMASGLAKAGLIAATAAYAGERTLKVAELRAQGKGGEALGTLVTTAAGFAAGYAGYKTQVAYAARNVAPVKIEIYGLRGASVSKTVGKDTSYSKGKFVITEGEFKGLHGTTAQISGKKAGYVITNIPEQKVGNIKVPAQTFKQFTKGGTVSEKLKLYYREAREGVFMVGEKLKLVGRQKEQTLLRTVAETPGKTRTGQDIYVRKFKGVGLGTEARDYKLYLVKVGEKVMLVEGSVPGQKQAVKIDWVDISMGHGISGEPSSGGISRIITVKPATAPAVPPSTMTLKAQVTPEVANVARIVPNVNPTAYPLRIKESLATKPETVLRQENVPAIIRRQDTGQQGRTVNAVAVAIRTAPQIVRPDTATRTTDIVKPEQIAITHPITGVEVSQQEKTSLMRKLSPIIERIASQPVTTPAIPKKPKMRPPNLPPMGIVPFLRLGKGTKFYLFKTGTIKNPVPDIRKLI